MSKEAGMLSVEEERSLKVSANRLRRRTIEMLYHSQAGHPGGSLSAADILATLYFRVMRIDPTRPEWEERDRFVLSKGHAAPVLYATLAQRGYFADDVLETYDEINSCLQGHPDMHTTGVDMSSGSLGQGLSTAVGTALGGRLDKRGLRVYALLGDGELQEGQIWEAAMSAAAYKLDNLVAIVDYNRLQLVDFIDSIIPIEPLAAKWLAFGWNVIEVDGHSVAELFSAFEGASMVKGKPTVILAHTVKGKGVSFMENQVVWHSKAISEADRDRALAELAVGEVGSNG
jgi:transketolase